jgi:hypothetical protein
VCGECGRNLAQAFFVLEIQKMDYPDGSRQGTGILVHECFPSFRGGGDGGSAGLVVCGAADFYFL